MTLVSVYLLLFTCLAVVTAVFVVVTVGSFFLPSFRNCCLFFFPLRARSKSCRAFDTEVETDPLRRYCRVLRTVEY